MVRQHIKIIAAILWCIALPDLIPQYPSPEVLSLFALSQEASMVVSYSLIRKYDGVSTQRLSHAVSQNCDYSNESHIYVVGTMQMFICFHLDLKKTGLLTLTGWNFAPKYRRVIN
jgi:hypothetical protein